MGLLFIDDPHDDRLRIVRKVVARCRCGWPDATLELRRYPLSRNVAWFCLRECGRINHSTNGNLYITYRKLRAADIDPFWLPKVPDRGAE
jgi:hypothetical protein